MEKSEPTLVPEWLKATGSASGGGTALHPLSSLPQLEDTTLRNRSSSHLLFSGSNANDYDSPRSSAYNERSSGPHFRRASSSNGGFAHEKESYGRSYSSFGRNHRGYDFDNEWDTSRSDRSRDREREFEFREKDRFPVGGDNRDKDRDHADAFTNNISLSMAEKELLRRSHSMVSARRPESKPRRLGSEAANVNGVIVGGSLVSSIQKAAFERDFPSLNAEDKHGSHNLAGSDIGRVPSPGLSNVTQSLPLGSASVIGGDGWTSALAEVPVIISSSSPMLSSVLVNSPSSPVAAAPSTPSGLNMAETLAQAPTRTRITPQVSVETQRLEELAIRQSRQLIPVTPSMPKASALNPSDKPKSKTVVRPSGISSVGKVAQQPPSVLANSVRGSVRVESPKLSQPGKLLVLKPNREKNGLLCSHQDNLTQLNTNRVVTTSVGIGLSAGNSPVGTTKNPKPTDGRKSPTLSSGQILTTEKRPSVQGQNRSEFFNSLRKKSSANVTAALCEANPASSLEAEGGQNPEVNHVDHMKEGVGSDDSETVHGNGEVSEESENVSDEGEYISEEDAVFLTSLGWAKESRGEGLTKEEINDYYESQRRNPTTRLRNWNGGNGGMVSDAIAANND